MFTTTNGYCPLNDHGLYGGEDRACPWCRIDELEAQIMDALIESGGTEYLLNRRIDELNTERDTQATTIKRMKRCEMKDRIHFLEHQQEGWENHAIDLQSTILDLDEQLRISKNAGKFAGETCVLHLKRINQLEAKLRAEYAYGAEQWARAELSEEKHTALESGLEHIYICANVPHTWHPQYCKAMKWVRGRIETLLGKESE